MSAHYLTYSFDIHGGGIDLVFPHHENELAQSCAACSESHVKYWVHNGFVLVNGEKMSKSLGNYFTIREVKGSCIIYVDTFLALDGCLPSRVYCNMKHFLLFFFSPAGYRDVPSSGREAFLVEHTL